VQAASCVPPSICCSSVWLSEPSRAHAALFQAGTKSAHVTPVTIGQSHPSIQSRYAELGFSVVVLLTSSAAVYIAAAAGWPGAPNHCVLAGDCYCEAARPGWVAQPSNTWSLLAFSLGGLGIAWHSCRTRRIAARRNRFTATSFYPALFCGIVTFMGPGGAFFHASLTNWGGAVDVLSMFLWIDFLIVYNLAVLYRWGPGRFLAVYLAATAVLMLPRVIQGPLGVPLFAVAFGLWLTMELAMALRVDIPGLRRPVRDHRWLLAHLAISICALGIWAMSHGNGPLCSPHSLLQGHAFWHVLNAVAFVLLFPYLRSERFAEGAAQQGAAADEPQPLPIDL
jgi:hypothetical protein